MAEQIFSPSMAALLQGGYVPSPMPPPVADGPRALSLAALARAGMLGPGSSTLTGIDRPPAPDAVITAGRGIDYGQPAPAHSGLTMAEMLRNTPREELTAPAGPEPFENITSVPTSGIAAMPQTLGEEDDLRQQGQGIANAAMVAATAAPVGRGVQIAERAVQAGARPVMRAVAANPTLAGFLTAGGMTAATPGQTSDAPPLRERAPDARRTETDVRSRLSTAEEDLRKAREDSIRYDSDKFNWGDPDAVEKAQRNFQGLGITVLDPKTRQTVPVPSDRRDGPLTRAGAAEYARRASARAKDLEANLGAIREELRRAGSAVTEAEGLDARDVSARRMQELDEPTLVQRFGPNAGVAAGIAKGVVDRYLLGLGFRGLARTRTARANTVMEDMGKGDANERVGRLNQFWTEGGSRNPPYAYTPGARPYPWTATPDAPPRSLSSVFTPRDPSATLNASRLYRPGPLENYGPIAGVGGAGAYEWHYGEGMIADAERELSAAMTAIAGKEAPTEAEMQRVRDARQGMAWAMAARNVGRGELLGGALTDLHMRTHVPSRPNMGRAEAERGQVDLLLNPPPAQVHQRR